MSGRHMNREHRSPPARQRVKEQDHQTKQTGKAADVRFTSRSGRSLHSSRLSPLHKRQQGEQQEEKEQHQHQHQQQQQQTKEKPKSQRGKYVSSSPMTQKGSSTVSPGVSKSSVAKERPSARRNNKSDNVLHIVAPLVPPVENELTANGYVQAEVLLPTSTSDSNMNLSFSRFAPLTERSASHEMEITTNPENGVKNEDEINTSAVFGEFLTDDMLREWTGWEDLHLVLSAEMHVDAVRTLGVDTLSERMPLLHSLRLNSSRIPQIRLLGTKYMNLKRLWLRGSRIECLRGIGACAPLLEELYASFNVINDITPLLDLSDTLEVVDLEGNEIRDSNTLIQSLPLLRKVKYLTLQGNPVEMSYYTFKESSTASEKGLSPPPSFRDFVRSLMPDLQYLDDIPLTENDTTHAHSSTTTTTTTTTMTKTKTKTLIPPKAEDNHTEEDKQDTSLVETKKRNSNHVDPLKVSLCDEYMFLQQCIRESGFDALDAAVEDETRSLYTRPQTSCAGARPRRSSLSAHVNNNPRACSSANAAGRRPIYNNNNNTRTPPSATFPPPNVSTHSSGTSTNVSPSTSSLTVGRPMVGGSAVSLRRRLPPLHPSSATHNISRVDSSSSKSDSTQSAVDGGQHGRLNNGMMFAVKERDDRVILDQDELQSLLSTAPIRMNDLSLDVPLFDDEDEWEMYKQSLLRRVDSQNMNAQRWIKYVNSEYANSSHGDHENVGLSGCSYSTSVRTTSASSNPTTLSNTQEMNAGQLPSTSLTSTHVTPPASTAAVAVVVESIESCAASEEVSPDDKFSKVRDVEEKGKGEREKEKLNDDEIKEEEENWRQELLRSVVRSRTRTARAGMSGRSLRLGDVYNDGMTTFEFLDNGDV
ncbi:putative leucine-rich repeat protein (LRRP) [Trypanosoma theileri]|uniref:Putative leucine-rich repeat protein (LRRP) n=1 Tax=Trypanosoma theileri TaxID=67003 RepID=A0A1X0P7D2_9TRYP|nr:putative leucine-rich repeat protein (LRRP) [Trypanosoma theileri]ORC92479.1 putative leucine-rich repeat protein (LRRP) [Trypanosoma theileri]